MLRREWQKKVYKVVKKWNLRNFLYQIRQIWRFGVRNFSRDSPEFWSVSHVIDTWIFMWSYTRNQVHFFLLTEKSSTAINSFKKVVASPQKQLLLFTCKTLFAYVSNYLLECLINKRQRSENRSSLIQVEFSGLQELSQILKREKIGRFCMREFYSLARDEN